MRLELENATILLSHDERWEVLVREELGDSVEIGHDELGVPILSSDFRFQISVSHTDGLTAVMLSKTPCGIDIERTDRDFSKAARRYLTSDEQNISSSSFYHCAAWCAREALYKRLKGRRGDGLMSKMRITEADIEGGKILLEITSKKYEIKLIIYEDYMIAYIAE